MGDLGLENIQKSALKNQIKNCLICRKPILEGQVKSGENHHYQCLWEQLAIAEMARKRIIQDDQTKRKMSVLWRKSIAGTEEV